MEKREIEGDPGAAPMIKKYLHLADIALNAHARFSAVEWHDPAEDISQRERTA
jgi:hypothetical protein